MYFSQFFKPFHLLCELLLVTLALTVSLQLPKERSSSWKVTERFTSHPQYLNLQQRKVMTMAHLTAVAPAFRMEGQRRAFSLPTRIT